MNDKPYQILRSKSDGTRAIRVIKSGAIIPVDIAGLCVGKDHWISQIKVKCIDCGTKTTCADLQVELCPDCYDKAGEEIEELNS